ncbi:hypothetical protein SUGI_0198700 [Cryptomeria japonica]|nr:hypothetical protein SUGI_0198700 [Cryptomeria japonica]
MFNTPSEKPFLNTPTGSLKQSSSLHPNSYELDSYPEHIDSWPSRSLNSKNYSQQFGQDIDDPGLEFRKKLEYLELFEVDTPRAIRENPLILSTSLHNIEKVVGFLQQWGMLHKDFGRIFGMCPQILTCNVDKNLVPILDFLLFEVKILRKDIRKCINRCPRILESSVTDQLRPTLQYLKKLGLQEERFADCSNTVLLVSSIENTLAPKLEYLQSLGFDHKDAVSMVVRTPGIFTFSIANNLKPKFDYLVNEMGGGLQDLLEFPQYFTFSLEKRIKPRHRLLVKHKLWLPLPAMLKKTEPDFFYTFRRQLTG